jgi:hypothetical protein
VSFRGLIGFIDHCSRQEDFANLGITKMLLSGLDLNRCIKGRIVSNLPLDFKQFSFTHIIKSWDDYAGERLPSSSLFRRAIFPCRFPFSVNRITSQVISSTCGTSSAIIPCHHAAHDAIFRFTGGAITMTGTKPLEVPFQPIHLRESWPSGIGIQHFTGGDRSGFQTAMTFIGFMSREEIGLNFSKSRLGIFRSKEFLDAFV